VMASGGVVADFDAIEISIRGSDGKWTPVSIKDPGFEADGTTNDWGRSGSSANAVVTRPSDGAAEGHRFLRLAPPSLTRTIAMIRGLHAMFYSSQASELRAFLKDTLGFGATDVGGGWLIFDVPEADLGIHPTEDNVPPSGTADISPSNPVGNRSTGVGHSALPRTPGAPQPGGRRRDPRPDPGPARLGVFDPGAGLRPRQDRSQPAPHT